mgnify:CR=1 FL=1
MKYVVNTLSLENINECTKLYVDVFNGEPWNDGWKEADAKERLTELFNHQRFLGIGIYNNKELIGFSLGYIERWLHSSHFYLNEMCIKATFQGKGIGSILISALEEYCMKNNISDIYLLTARDGQAEAFYRKNGYSVNDKMIAMSKQLEN